MSIVVKASQRANGRQLATHLLNAQDNEQVEVAEVKGTIAQDLPGALDEWYALSRATRCKKYLYHLSINPDPTNGSLTPAQYMDFIARVEKKLGLSDQPRTAVFHIKADRNHCHVVWSRIARNQIKAIQISHDHKSLQTIIKGFAKDHGLKQPGSKNPLPRPGKQISANNVTLHEKQQQERTGISKEERMSLLTRLWNHTEDGPTFLKALALKGFHLARGEKVPYVVVDPFGEIHSLPRQIEGVRTKDIRARFNATALADLPPAAELRKTILAQHQAPTTNIFNLKAKASWTNLKQDQYRRRASFKEKTETLRANHREARTTLITQQKQTYQKHQTDRLHHQFGPLTRYIRKIPGLNTLIADYNKRQDKILLHQYRAERKALARNQKHEWEDLIRQARAITRVEKRERRSLKTKLHREYLQATVKPAPVSPPLTGYKLERKAGGLTPTFNAQAKDQETKDTISETFNDHASPPPEEFGTGHQPHLALG